MSRRIQCPLCDSHNVSTTLGSKAKTGGIYLAGLGASVLTKSILSSVGLDGIRTNVSGATKSMLRSVVPMDYKCKCCDCVFTVMFTEEQEVKSVKVNQYPIPDEIIQKEKDAYVKQLESEISYIPVIFPGLTCLGLFIYCWNAPFKYQEWREATWLQDAGYYDAWHYSWLFWAFLCLVFLIMTLCFIDNIGHEEEKLDKIKEQNLKDFKSEHYELFEKYDQKTLADYYNCHFLGKG